MAPHALGRAARFSGGLPFTQPRWPLKERTKKVSSASITPERTAALSCVAALRNLWRQRQTVVWFTPIPASTIFLTDRCSVMWLR